MILLFICIIDVLPFTKQGSPKEHKIYATHSVKNTHIYAHTHTHYKKHEKFVFIAPITMKIGLWKFRESRSRMLQDDVHRFKMWNMQQYVAITHIIIHTILTQHFLQFWRSECKHELFPRLKKFLLMVFSRKFVVVARHAQEQTLKTLFHYIPWNEPWEQNKPTRKCQ